MTSRGRCGVLKRKEAEYLRYALCVDVPAPKAVAETILGPRRVSSFEPLESHISSKGSCTRHSSNIEACGDTVADATNVLE